MAENALKLYDQLAHALNTQDTVTNLFKVANSDEFKNSAHTLSKEQLSELRKIYRSRQTELDGKVKLQDFIGQTLSIFDVGFWHSEQWNNDGVTIRFTVDGSTVKYKALTSSAPIVRFVSQLDPQPSEQKPVRMLLDSRPVSDEARAKQGQTVFRPKRLPDASAAGNGSEGSPF